MAAELAPLDDVAVTYSIRPPCFPDMCTDERFRGFGRSVNVRRTALEWAETSVIKFLCEETKRAPFPLKEACQAVRHATWGAMVSRAFEPVPPLGR